MKAFNTNTYQNLFILFSFSIPVQGRFLVLPTIIGFILLILFPFISKKKDLLKLKNGVFLLYFLLMLFITIITLFTKRYEDMKIIKKMIIPLLLIIISLPIVNIRPAIIGFISGSIITIIISSINLIFYVKENNTFKFANGEEINNILYTERPYLGYICVTSLLLLVYLQKFIYIKAQKILVYLLCLSIFIFLFIISARLSLITIFLSIIYLIVVSSISYKFKVSVFICLIGIVITFFCINKNLQERFLMKNDKSIKLNELIKEEPRTYIWGCSKTFIENNPFIFKGIGFYNTERYLVTCFSSSNKFINNEQKEWFIESHFNTHNQFLGFYIGGGIVAFFLFLSFIVLLVYKLYKNKITILLVFSLVSFCLVENMLHRQEGSFLFGITFIFALLLYYDEEKVNKKLKSLYV